MSTKEAEDLINKLGATGEDAEKIRRLAKPRSPWEARVEKKGLPAVREEMRLARAKVNPANIKGRPKTKKLGSNAEG